MTERERLPVQDPAADQTDWPFTSAQLTAGLRRYLHDVTVKISEISPMRLPHRQPSIGEIRGLQVRYQGSSGEQELALVLKEPRGTTRTGLAGAGRREVGFYRSLASQVPIRTPALVAFSDLGDWLVMECLQPQRDAKEWRADDYLTAISGLADLHNRFWDLREDLGTFAWLSDPLEGDFEVHMASVGQAIDRLSEGSQRQTVTGSRERVRLLKRLSQDAEQVVQPLREQPATLLHGDYWPGNIAILESGEQATYDWQLAGIGPAIIDVLVFVNKSEWWFRPLPTSESDLVDRYRQMLEQRGGQSWLDAEWDRLWDHALMWRFLQEWLDILAVSPDPILTIRAEQLDQIWLGPVEEAMRRRLKRGA